MTDNVKIRLTEHLNRMYHSDDYMIYRAVEAVASSSDHHVQELKIWLSQKMR